MRRASVVFASVAAVLVVASCDENLPSGPTAFPAQLDITLAGDTMVVGQTRLATAVVTDGQGHVVSGLKYGWSSADTDVVSLTIPDGEDSTSGSRRFVAKRPGQAVVTLSLSDQRFTTVPARATVTSVVGGVRVTSSHDTTLTAVNDTGFAIATSLVQQSAADPTLINRVSQGIQWTHIGNRTSVVGTGDTIRYIARSNGADTLIASHPFCLAGARCADTVIARVNQQLTLTLSARTFQQFSFSDSVGPSIVLADRRGNGLAGTSIRFVPRTSADSAVVKVVGPFGQSNPTTGAMAVPKLVTAGNGTATVDVQAIAPNGFAILATDNVSVTVRQVARRVAVEPMRALITTVDSIPIRGVARDARGAVIADATVAITPININIRSQWAVPSPLAIGFGTLTPTLSGIALPVNNPNAPQVPVTVHASTIGFTAADTVVAGVTQRTIDGVVLDSLGQPASGKWVRFGAPNTVTPDSVVLAVDGTYTVLWTPPNLSGKYTLTGLRGPATPPVTVADSAGRVVLVHTTVVKHDVPSPVRSTLTVQAATIATNATTTVFVTLRDQFGNAVRSAMPTDFTASVSDGTLGAFTCGTTGLCTATFTAPATAGTVALSVKIGAVEIGGSPLNLTIQ